MLPSCIAAFGASTVFGRVDPEGGGFIGRLKTWHESRGRKNRVYNMGISSESSADLLKRLMPEATPRKPDLILLTTGTNDTRHAGSAHSPSEIPLRQFEKNVRELLRQAKKLAPVIFLKMQPIDDRKTQPMPGNGFFFLNQDLQTYGDAAERICAQESIPCCDVCPGWMKRDYKTWLTEDGLHPNAEGHQRMFETLRDFLIGQFGD
jgi:lysophospholipase L1-like esterase